MIDSNLHSQTGKTLIDSNLHSQARTTLIDSNPHSPAGSEAVVVALGRDETLSFWDLAASSQHSADGTLRGFIFHNVLIG